MADEPDNLFLQYLGRFDQKLDRVVDEMLDVKVRLNAVEEGFAAVDRRLDRLEIPHLRTATQQWVNTKMRRLGVTVHDCKARKT